jgi:hypothetical protein
MPRRLIIPSTAISVAHLEHRILVVRGHKVMLDADLAELYGVDTRVLKQAVKRNPDRFPEDFLFERTWEEAEEVLRSQFVTLKRDKHFKYRPYAFTEHGVAMLSSVLRSRRAVQANIAIMRAFVRLREWLATNRELNRRVEDLERNVQVVFDVLRELQKPETNKSRERIGFHRRP